MAEQTKPQRLYTQEEVNALLLKSAEDRIAHDKNVGCVSVGLTVGVGGALVGGPFGAAVGAGAGCWLGRKITGDTSDAVNMIPSPSEMDNIINESKKIGRAIEKTYEQEKEKYKDYIPEAEKLDRAFKKLGKEDPGQQIPSHPAPSIEPEHGLPRQPAQRDQQQWR